MKILGIIIALALVIGGAYYFMPELFGRVTENVATTTPQSSARSYASAEHGIAFEYPATYSLREDDATVGLQEVFFITLADTEAIAGAPQGGEGPPSISIGVFATDATSTEDWIRTEARSNFSLSPDGKLTPTSVNGKPGLSYESDGLYATHNVVVISGGRAYHFSVGWLTREDAMIGDFENILANVELR